MATLPSLLSSSPNNSQSSPIIPTMSEILAASEARGLRLQLTALGPFFRVRGWRAVAGAATGEEVGRTEGVIRWWFGGKKILHLDSIKMTRATLEMDRSVFGLGLFVGAVAVRHGFDSGCDRAELLAVNDSPLFHSKLVRFYTRMGFKAVHEVDGGSVGDLAHMLVWGGRGTKMDADVHQLLIKWSKVFKPPG